MKQKKIPLRTCIGCRAVKPKRELIRIVSTVGDIVVDTSGKLSGRGAYVCLSNECLEIAIKKKRISYALRAEVEQDVIEKLKAEMHSFLSKENNQPKKC